MKKFLLMAIALVMSATASAGYGYMLFYTNQSTDPEVIATENLVITIDDENLMISNSKDRPLTLPLSTVSAMEFSAGSYSSVGLVSETDGKVSLYSADGLPVGDFSSLDEAVGSLPAGIYVIRKTNGDTVKIMIGK